MSTKCSDKIIYMGCLNIPVKLKLYSAELCITFTHQLSILLSYNSELFPRKIVSYFVQLLLCSTVSFKSRWVY